jgi:hypothetical protein
MSLHKNTVVATELLTVLGAFVSVDVCRLLVATSDLDPQAPIVVADYEVCGVR